VRSLEHALTQLTNDGPVIPRVVAIIVLPVYHTNWRNSADRLGNQEK